MLLVGAPAIAATNVTAERAAAHPIAHRGSCTSGCHSRRCGLHSTGPACSRTQPEELDADEVQHSTWWATCNQLPNSNSAASLCASLATSYSPLLHRLFIGPARVSTQSLVLRPSLYDSGTAHLWGQRSSKARHAPLPSRHITTGTPSRRAAVGRRASRSLMMASGYLRAARIT
jgi:hypothetical protein